MKIGVPCILACLYFLLLPTTIAVNSAGNSILKLAAVPIGVLFLLSIVFSKQELQLNAVHLLLGIFTLTTAITLFVESGGDSVGYVIGYALNAVLYMVLSAVRYNDRELKLLEDVQILLLVILLGITLLSNGVFFNRTTLKIFGQTCDPNYFVGFFIFPLSITMQRILRSKYRVGYILLALLSFYCVFLSGSRGGLAAIIVTIMAFALIYPPKFKHKMLVLLAGCGILLCTWFIAAPFLPELIVERMSIKDVIETGGTGRWSTWKSMLEEVANTPSKLMLGRGINAMHKVFQKGKWADVVAHNHLIQTLYNQGVVGVIAFLLLAFGCMLRCIRCRKPVAVAILGMLAISMSLSFNPTTRTFWNLVAYAAFNFSGSATCTSSESLKLPEEKLS